MKKIILFLFISYSALSFSQSMQVQNMFNYLRNKEYEKARKTLRKFKKEDDFYFWYRLKKEAKIIFCLFFIKHPLD